MSGPQDYAYLAGMIDADGCIRINRVTKTPKGCSRPATYYSAEVSIAGTRRQPHDFASQVFGGSVRSYQPKNPAHRLLYSWKVNGPKASSALASLLPYLRVKRMQALLAIELQSVVVEQFSEIKATTVPPYMIPPAMVSVRERLFLYLTSINQSRNRRVNLDALTADDYTEETLIEQLDSQVYEQFPDAHVVDVATRGVTPGPTSLTA